MAYTKEQINKFRRAQLSACVIVILVIVGIWWVSAPTVTMHEKAMADLIQLAQEKQCAPIFVRLAWHDAGTYDQVSGTGGPRGTIRFLPESGYAANAGLQKARDFIAPIKERYPHISHADMFAMAGVAGIRAAGGPSIPFRPGRADDTADNTAPDGRLPDATQGAAHLRQIFYRMGFSDREIVVLSGAHTLGRFHPDRSGFDGPWTGTPLMFDNSYFQVLLNERWLPSAKTGEYKDSSGKLTMAESDMALKHDEIFLEYVRGYAEQNSSFRVDFSKAFQKLLELGWSGKLGEPIYPK